MPNPIYKYFTNMDARAARTIVVSVALFLGIALIFLMGRTTAIFDEDDAPIFAWLQESASSPWALPVTILIFTVAAFIGAPQFVLIAGAVVALGPARGFAYAWIATLVSASVDFWLARRFGAAVLRRYGGDAVNRISKFVGKTGFWSSLAVRIVPSAPFIVINLAAGASHMSYRAFVFGTGIGIVPKTAFVAFAGGSVVALANTGNVVVALALAAAAGVWLIAVLWARKAMRGDDTLPPSDTGPSDTGPSDTGSSAAAASESPAKNTLGTAQGDTSGDAS